MTGNWAHFIFLAAFCFPAQPVLYCWQPQKLIWNKWTWSALPKANSTATEDLFSFILAAQIASAGDLLVTDPLRLPLSYLNPIVQAHNGCLCAFSLLPILNSRSPVLSLQYVQCKWQDSEWWWMFETGGGAGCYKPSWSISWLWGCQSEWRSGRHLACFPEPFISCWEPSSQPTGSFSKQQDQPATQYVPQSESHSILAK